MAVSVVPPASRGRVRHAEHLQGWDERCEFRTCVRSGRGLRPGEGACRWCPGGCNRTIPSVIAGGRSCPAAAGSMLSSVAVFGMPNMMQATKRSVMVLDEQSGDLQVVPRLGRYASGGTHGGALSNRAGRRTWIRLLHSGKCSACRTFPGRYLGRADRARRSRRCPSRQRRRSGVAVFGIGSKDTVVAGRAGIRSLRGHLTRAVIQMVTWPTATKRRSMATPLQSDLDDANVRHPCRFTASSCRDSG